MKKICFITQCSLPIPTSKGGAVETLVEYLLNENEINREYFFTVISVHDNKAFEESRQYQYTRFIYIKQHNKFLNKMLLLIYRILKQIHIYIPFSLEFKNALKNLHRLEEQDYYIFEAGPTTQLPALGRIIPKDKLLVHLHWDGMANRLKDSSFSYLLPVSDYIGRQWEKKSSCDSEKIIPFYNCAKIERFTRECSIEEKKELRRKLGIPENHKVIIFTGRIVKEKGIKELLQAFELLKHQDTTLLIIGSANFGKNTNTPYEQEIEKLIHLSKKNTVFTGYVHQTELYKYYSIADIAVMPSLFQDPAPLVCIETQATGTPLIATCVGGIPEYIGNDSAILVKLDNDLVENLVNEIDELLENTNARIILKKNSQLNAMKFNTQNYFRNFSTIIESISVNEK